MTNGNTANGQPPKIDGAEEPGGWRAVFYLWHLAQMNVLEPQGPVPTTEGSVPRYQPSRYWIEPTKGRTRVAIIDSGCTSRHPNLPASAIESAIDFAPSLKGAVYGLESPEKVTEPIAKLRESARARIADFLLSVPEKSRHDLVALAEQMVGIPPEHIPTDNPADTLSGHGTACAGLVAGRFIRRYKDAAKKQPIAEPSVLRYLGVNPFATIVPISTPYSHEIKPLIAALFHAVVVDADVILMPRAVNDILADLTREPAEDGRLDSTQLRATRIDSQLKHDKALFEALLSAVAAWRPVVVASGNEGLEDPAYPASLVTSSAPHLIVVGAANERGFHSSYSNGSFATGVDVYAPSDDEERIDGRGAWFDGHAQDATWVRHALSTSGDSPYVPYSILAIDVPARTLPGVELKGQTSHLPLRALYSSFGGTSSAAAQIAGAVSLVQMTLRERGLKVKSGSEMKELLAKQQPATNDSPGAAVSVLDLARLMEAAGL